MTSTTTQRVIKLSAFMSIVFAHVMVYLLVSHIVVFREPAPLQPTFYAYKVLPTPPPLPNKIPSVIKLMPIGT